VYANNQAENFLLLKQRQAELLLQIAARQKDQLEFVDLKEVLLQTQVAIFQMERGMPPQSKART
jgi:hypothetical protein